MAFLSWTLAASSRPPNATRAGWFGFYLTRPQWKWGCRRGAAQPWHRAIVCPESCYVCWPHLPMCLSGLPARFCSFPDVSLAVPPKSTRMLGLLDGETQLPALAPAPLIIQKALHGSQQFPESLAPCSEGLGPEKSPHSSLANQITEQRSRKGSGRYRDVDASLYYTVQYGSRLSHG